MPAPHKRTTTQRGLGATHQRIAKALKPAALGQPCPGPYTGPRSPNCIGLMTDVKLMDLDENPPRSSGLPIKERRVCCQACNRSHGGRLGAQHTNTTKATPTPSRRW